MGEGPLVCLPLYPQHLDLCFAQNGHSVSICWMDIEVVHLEEQELPLAPPLDPNLVGDNGHHMDIYRAQPACSSGAEHPLPLNWVSPTWGAKS